MKQVSVRELRALLAHVDEVLAEEGELIVTNRGRPVARLVPVARGKAMPLHAEHRAKMPRWDVGSEVLLREDRDSR